MSQFGSKERCAIVVGSKLPQKALRTVEIWVANTHLTVCDSSAFVPQFIFSLQAEERRLISELNFLRHERLFFGLSVEEAFRLVTNSPSTEIEYAREDLRIFSLGPTTDDFISLLLPVQGSLYLTFQLYDSGTIGAVSILPFELVTVIQAARKELVDLSNQSYF